MDDVVLIMLDCESLDVGEKPVVTEVCAKRFDIDTANEYHAFHEFLDIDSQVSRGSSVSNKCISGFWMQDANLEAFDTIMSDVQTCGISVDRFCVSFATYLIDQILCLPDDHSQEQLEAHTDCLRLYEQLASTEFPVQVERVIAEKIRYKMHKNKLAKNFRICVNHAHLSDASWLTQLYKIGGWETPPFMFFNFFDISVLVDTCRWTLGIDPKTEIPFVGTPHNSVDDVDHQIKYTVQLMQTIKGK